MNRPIIPREQVAEHFAVAPTVLARYEARGLVRAVREGAIEGYEPAEVRRVWTVLSLHRDLGINLAGVEAILRLRGHLEQLHRQLDALAREMSALVEGDAEAQAEGDADA